MDKIRFIIISIFLASFLLVADWPSSWSSPPSSGGGTVVRDSTDWKLCQTGANVTKTGSSCSWTTPTNIYVCDGVDSVQAIIPDEDLWSDWLRATNFGFTTSDIPSDAEITGIEVKIRRRATGSSPRIQSIYLLKESTRVGDDNVPVVVWTTTYVYETVGAICNDWGAGLVATDIHNSGFGVDFSVYSVSIGSKTAWVDCIQIRVFYIVIE